MKYVIINIYRIFYTGIEKRNDEYSFIRANS